jgi:hypothetical protein
MADIRSAYMLFGKAVLWLRRLVASLPPRSRRFVPGSVYVGFVVDKVALGQVFLSSSVLPVSIIPPWLSILISFGDEQKARQWLQFRDVVLPHPNEQ